MQSGLGNKCALADLCIVEAGVACDNWTKNLLPRVSCCSPQAVRSVVNARHRPRTFVSFFTHMRPFASLLILLSFAVSPALLAQRAPPPTTRTIAEYNVDDVTLRISADAPRVEVFLWRKPQAIVVYLDSRSIERWMDLASAFIASDGPVPNGAPVERSTPVLRHADSSYRSGLELTRRATDRRSQLFLTAWVGDHSAAMVPMRRSQARGFLAALREAAYVARRPREHVRP